ncbi:scopoletin glucosyltransferase [Quercus suber]|uniref:Scopoletin glucosyltransferase n=1 Tax=Quercus suber TaxID=58331 RepID=A0AAW0L9J2_QUESU
MASESRRQLHVFFFPFLAHGHLIPTMDMAKLFAARGVKATFVTTPRNVPSFSKTRGINIDIQIIQFPAVEAGLPEGCENIDSIENSIEMVDNFFKATKMLKQPLEQLLQDFQPSCLVADMFFPWATDIAAKFGIPRLVFHGTCSFSLSVDLSLRQYEPHKKVSSDSEPFVIPNFPGEIKLIRMQLPNFIKHEVETDLSKLLKEVVESDLRSYGVVVNSFYELEPAYAEHYKKVIGRKTWHIVGVDVGVRRWIRVVGDSIKRDAIEKAVKRIMVGEEADRMRSRAKVLGEMAKRAVEEGGSSYSDLNALIEELRLHCP